ncbi:MAG: tRNA (5-methylaminomethyl-2-thiouridine)(34)-methyltransferase MnmD [Pseudomonadota bacterium]
MADQQAEVDWTQDGVPVSRRFDDPYYSFADGLAETQHVFLAGNDLPHRFYDGFHIAELGFGTGLSFLAAVAAFRAAGVEGVLRFTSFEAFPMDRTAQIRALSRYPNLPAAALDGAADVDLQIIKGDARDTLPLWHGTADAWFLDGFSPAKNPELWEDTLLNEVARHTAPKGTAATYTAAGFVRRGLEAAGFHVERVPGFGRKRHMTRAWLTP